MAATTLRVLAAEISDAGRLTRGRRLRADGAVIDLAVGHGAVVARVQGSLATPYVVTLETRPGQWAPSRRELTVRCTCPDDAGTGQHGCKHIVAALLGLADEVMIEPELLARWRRSDDVTVDEVTVDDVTVDEVTVDDVTVDDVTVDEQAPGDASGAITEIAGHTGQSDTAEPAAGRSEPAHPLSILMQAPGDGRLPPLPMLAELEHPRFPDPALDQLLADARDQLRVRWD